MLCFPVVSMTPKRANHGLARILGAVACRIVGGGFIQLAVKRRAANLDSARDLRHLSAIMRDRKADALVLHIFQRPHLTGPGPHAPGPIGRSRSYRYLDTFDPRMK